MKKITILVLILSCNVIGLSQSPIIITSTNMPSSNDTIRYSNASLTGLGNYSITGANYNWHFENLIPVSQDVRAFKSALQTPYAFFFVGPGKFGEKISDSIGVGALKFTDIYNFYKKNGTSSFNAEGLGLKYSGLPIPAFFTNEDELYFFPLNYTDRDSSTFRFSTPSSTALPTYIKNGYRITEADGWGTVYTPYGSSTCLRVVTTQYSIDSTIIYLGGFPIKFGVPNYQRSYQWLTQNEKIPYLEISGNLLGSNFTPTQVKFRDIPRVVGIGEINKNDMPVSVFPNPVSSQLALQIPKSESLILTILSVDGKVIKTKPLINNEDLNTHIIDVSDLIPGTYRGVLQNQKIVQNFKFNKL